ncbi:MAG: MFS transporter [Actinomycetota bacterium]
MTPPETRDDQARFMVAVAFGVSGFTFAALMSRAPTLAAALGLSPGEFGRQLLALSAGAVSGLLVAQPAINRIGPPRVVSFGALTCSTGLIAISGGASGMRVLGSDLPRDDAEFISRVVASLGLFAMGCGMGMWDVGMNVAGADVAQRMGSATLMPRLHAMFSAGTIAGAGAGALNSFVGVPLPTQLMMNAGLLPPVLWWATRQFPPDHAASPSLTTQKESLSAWREPRTIKIGLCVLGFMFAEGAANEWLAYALVNGYGTTETVGAVAFGLFVTTMTVGRFVGGGLISRYGSVVVLRGSVVVALLGLLMTLSGTSAVIACLGALCWGAGVALGVPAGMNAGADDPARSAARISVISFIGYIALLAGPPLIGFLADWTGILPALLAAAVALIVAASMAGATAPRGHIVH